MKIAIEAQRIFRRDKHGMDFVVLEVLRELQKRKDGNEYYVLVAPGEDCCLKESDNLHIIELRCPTYPLWEQIALPRAVRRLKVDILHCTKVYAIQQVMERYSPHEYDMIVVFNSDNRVVPNALHLLNNAYYSGCDSIQAHRMTENLTTSTAVLAAAGEEINNNIFRKGHTKLGFSSALLGSGMAFDFEMFHRISPTLEGSDLAKAVEIKLLEENIYTEYMQEIICYSKKQDSAQGYSRERQRWLSAQYNSTFLALRRLPLAFLQGKWDYCNKLFQWLLPSRFLLIACITIAAVIFTILDWTLSFKWYILLLLIIITFLMALPEGEINKRFKHAVWALPILIFASIFSHFGRIFRSTKKNK